MTELSNKLHLETKDFVRDKQEADSLGVTRIPAFVLQGRARGKVRFFGIPTGYEFSTLVEDLLDLSKGTTNLEEPVVQIAPHSADSDTYTGASSDSFCRGQGHRQTRLLCELLE